MYFPQRVSLLELMETTIYNWFSPQKMPVRVLDPGANDGSVGGVVGVKQVEKAGQVHQRLINRASVRGEEGKGLIGIPRRNLQGNRIVQYMSFLFVQRESTEDMNKIDGLAIFRAGFVTHFGEVKLAIGHTKRIFHLSPHTGL